MEANKGLKKLSLEDMDRISGGVIVRAKDAWWILSDTPDEKGNYGMYGVGFLNRNEAIREAELRGWSSRFLTKEEFEQEFGIEDFNPTREFHEDYF